MLGVNKAITAYLAMIFLAICVVPALADDDDDKKSKKNRKDMVEIVFVEGPTVGLPEGLDGIAFIPFSQAVEDKEGLYSAREKRWGNEIISAIAERMQQSAMRFNIPLKIIDRQSVAVLLKEKDLADAGLAEESKALQVGKLAKAQAICYGLVSIDIRTVEGQSKTLRFFPSPHRINIQQQPVRQLRRTVTLSANIKLVATATGKVILPYTRRLTETSEMKPSIIMGEDAQEIQMRPEGEVIERLISQVVDEFVGQLMPHEVHIEVKVAKVKSKPAKAGLKLAQANEWDKAIELFREGLQEKPKDHGAWYDLGLAYEITGRFDKALESYERAYSIKDQQYYLEGVQRVKPRAMAMKQASQSGGQSTKGGENAVEQAPASTNGVEPADD